MSWANSIVGTKSNFFGQETRLCIHVYSMRRKRFLRAGSRYHVAARTNNREILLESDEARALFVSVLERAHEKYRFSIDSFVIMGNHFHIIILPGEGESLSSIMQWIMSVFARAYNRRFNRTGHFWGDRFASWLLDSIRQILRTILYIEENPVKAGLVDTSDVWIWGSRWHRRNRRLAFLSEPDSWLS